MPSRYDTPRNRLRMERLRAVQAQCGKTLNQIVYRWLLQQEPAILPLTSPSNRQQMSENLGALDFALTAEQMRLLNQLD
jgi:aryl-alcohol dehydrogenase-like predicted oxidoreductase